MTEEENQKKPPKLDRAKVRAVECQNISHDCNFNSEPQHDLLHCRGGQTGGCEQVKVFEDMDPTHPDISFMKKKFSQSCLKYIL